MKKISVFILLTGLTLLFYGHFVETNRIVTTRVTIKNDALAAVLQNLTVVHISDFHFENSADPMLERVVQKLNEIKPDLIFMTGDYVEWFATDMAYQQAQQLFSRLQAPQGIFAVMGDADYSVGSRHCLFCHSDLNGTIPQNPNVRFLQNSSRDVLINNRPLRILGLDPVSPVEPKDDPLKAICDTIPGIILSHESVPFDEISDDKNILMLSGDTHGGQVWLPIEIWKLTKRKPDPQHMYGYFKDGNKHLFVTNGIGTSSLDIRLAVPPQIAVLQFVKNEDSLE